MKKINENDYVNFVFECQSFTMTGSLKTIMRLFEERTGNCTVYGIKPNGDWAIVESK